MVINMKKSALLIVCVLLLSMGTLGHAKIFENVSKGGRSLGVGGAFTAGDGVESVFYNIAGLATVKGIEFEANLQPSVTFENMSVYGSAIAVRLPMLSVGGYIHMQNLSGYLSETTLVAGAAMDLPVLKKLFKKVTVGAGVRLYMLSKDFNLAGEADSVSAISFDLGLRFQISKTFVLGIAVQNLLTPTMSFFSVDGVGEKTDLEFRIGMKWALNEFFSLYTDYVNYPDSGAQIAAKGLHIGGEMMFYNVFLLRVGIDEGNLAIGLGLKTGNVDIDLAIKNQGELGMYYQTGIILKF